MSIYHASHGIPWYSVYESKSWTLKKQGRKSIDAFLYALEVLAKTYVYTLDSQTKV